VVVTAPKLASADQRSATFTYSNLSGRRSSHLLTLLARVLPGVKKVENEIATYAAAWHEHNIAALASSKPLWVVLGDSLSQGVGASSIEQSWVEQAARKLAAVGLDYRVINLSISGATVTDVLDRQIPALDGLASTPAVVTVLIGSNDVIHHNLRSSLLAHYRAMLAALPRGAFVGIPDRARGALGEIAELVAEQERNGAVHAVQVRVSSSLRAEDHFHFNDGGYALFAEDFADAIARHANEPT
jgi:lysophospholipase L1-like esterase